MKRSKFSLSHYKLLTCDMGNLIPISWFEVLPGDTVQQSTSMLVRCSPLLAPVMHPVQIRIHHWYVPNRLLWDTWEDFITGGPDGMDATVFPHFAFDNTAGYAKGTLADYLGLPPGAATQNVSALPFRAYTKIFNEHYRDQDLVTELAMSESSGLDNATNRALASVAWEKDYFTTARPWTQKGPAVTIPIAGLANIIPSTVGSTTPTFNVGAAATNRALASDATTHTLWSGAAPGVGANASWNTTGLQADLSTSTGVSINELREAFALQRYEEARARFGSRYTEYLSYLGVTSPDARLQRPEYLGGGKQTIQFSEVLQTAPSDLDDSVVGDLKGHGIGAVRSNRYRRFFPEHGIVMSLMSIKPKTMYTQGIHRSWTRQTKEDYWQRELQHIGQQAILNREVYGISGTLGGTFGYQDRYDEYRRSESSVAGDFRDTLDHWHYARIFSAPPTLNASFVTSDPTKRVNAVQTEDVLWIMANHSIQARRMVAGVGSSFIK